MRVLFALAALVAGAAASISDCDPTSLFRPTELAVSPDPPVRNQPVTMTVKFDNPGATVTDGSVTTSVTLNFIPFQPSTEPLCDNTACPIVTGANDRSTTSTWPDTVSGTVITTSKWAGVNGESLLCVKTSLRVASGAQLRGSTNATANYIYDLFRDDLSRKQLAERLEWGFNGTCPAPNADPFDYAQ